MHSFFLLIELLGSKGSQPDVVLAYANILCLL